MAKYDINYCCGHGSVEKQLFGKYTDRDRKIEWMEANICCPECYREKQSTTPLRATVLNNAFSDGPQLAITSGNSYAIKDDLKSLGFRWGEYQDNQDILGASKPKRAWMYPLTDISEDAMTRLVESLQALGVQDITINRDPMSAISAELARRVS